MLVDFRIYFDFTVSGWYTICNSKFERQTSNKSIICIKFNVLNEYIKQMQMLKMFYTCKKKKEDRHKVVSCLNLCSNLSNVILKTDVI